MRPPSPPPLRAAIGDHVVIGRVREHEIGGLAHCLQDRGLEDVEAGTEVESVGFDAHLASHFDGSAAPHHRVGKDPRAEMLEDPLIHMPGTVSPIPAAPPRAAIRKRENAAVRQCVGREPRNALGNCVINRHDCPPFRVRLSVYNTTNYMEPVKLTRHVNGI